MCDVIFMPDGEIIDGFEGEDTCLCGKTQAEILAYIVARIPTLEYEETLLIKRDWSGYNVLINKPAEIVSPARRMRVVDGRQAKLDKDTEVE